MPAISFDALPDDVLLFILALTTPLAVRRCQQVCRFLHKFIVTNDYLQYRLELDACGYMEPHCPRVDLNYAEKTQVLRDHNARWDNLANLTPETYRLPLGPSVPPRLFELVAGSLVWGEDTSPDHTRFTIYQLSSNNRGTGFEHRQFEVPFEAQCLAIDPEQDLIALLEVDNPRIPSTVRKIHLRAVNTNEPHPNAASELLTVRYTRVSTNYEEGRSDRITLFGSSLAGIFDLMGHTSYDLVVWNWMTGHQLLHFTLDFVPHERTFELLTESLFVVVRARLRDEESLWYSTNAPGCLEVYEFDPHAELPKPAVHSSSFELPPLVLNSPTQYEITIQLEAAVCPQVGNQYLRKVYNLAPGDRLLWVTGPFESDPRWRDLRLCTPISTLLDSTPRSAMLDSNHSVRYVPWDDWASLAFHGEHLSTDWCPAHRDEAAAQRIVFGSASSSGYTELSVADFNRRRLRVHHAHATSGDAAIPGHKRPRAKPQFVIPGQMSGEELRNFWHKEGYIPLFLFLKKMDDEHVVVIKRTFLGSSHSDYDLLVYNM